MNDPGFLFLPAARVGAPLIIVASGPSGSGKTYTLLELATGLAQGKRVALIDTEGGRAKLYADYFQFDHCEFRAPYTPRRFLQALQLADNRGYGAIIVDSFSDEYVGEGGMVDMANEDAVKFRGNTAGAWARPKAENKLVVRWFRQARCHVLLGLRAEEKVRLEKVRGDDGREKTIVVPIGYVPICEKNLMYEATLSFMLHPEAPGVPAPVKLPEQFRGIFAADRAITRRTGSALADWCAGGALAPPTPPRSGKKHKLTTGEAGLPKTETVVSKPDLPPENSGQPEKASETPLEPPVIDEKDLPPPRARPAEVEKMARQCAEMGFAALRTFYKALTIEERDSLGELWEELVPRARAVDHAAAVVARSAEEEPDEPSDPAAEPAEAVEENV